MARESDTLVMSLLRRDSQETDWGQINQLIMVISNLGTMIFNQTTTLVGMKIGGKLLLGRYLLELRIF